MAPHRLVNIHGVAAGHIKTGQPHIADNHQLERVVRILEAFFQSLLGLLVVDMRLQQLPVRGGAGHDNLDRPLFRIWIMPVRPQSGDGVIEMHADFPAHADDHRLAGDHLRPRLKMGHQILGHLLQTRFVPRPASPGPPICSWSVPAAMMSSSSSMTSSTSSFSSSMAARLMSSLARRDS